MVIVSYDISDDKMRTNFSKMLKKARCHPFTIIRI